MTSRASVAAMSAGKPGGASSASQLSASLPCTPASASVCRSGSAGERLLEASASARARPERMCGSEVFTLTAVICTSPAISAWIAGAPPL